MTLKCPGCGSENEAQAIFCTACRRPLKDSVEKRSSPDRQSRVGILAFGMFVAILVAVMLIFVWLSKPAEDDENHGSIVITLINPSYFNGLPCEYVLEINGQPVYNGTVPVAESEVVQENFSFTSAEFVVVVHVEVIGSTTQPEDMTVIITPGEVERITISLRMTTS